VGTHYDDRRREFVRDQRSLAHRFDVPNAKGGNCIAVFPGVTQQILKWFKSHKCNIPFQTLFIASLAAPDAASSGICEI
jgi:glycerol-3-phosphate responsive antiterminator